MSKQLLIINKNLPRPKQKVRGHMNCLHLTTQMGFRIDVDNSLQEPVVDTVMNRLIIDDKLSVCFGGDGTLARYIIPKEYIIIGDAISWNMNPREGLNPYLINLPTPTKTSNHISSPWNVMMWRTEIIKTKVLLQDRIGWCCTMHKKKPHRDKIATLLQGRYRHLFDLKHSFCYDWGDQQFADLEQFMFKPLIKGPWEVSTENVLEAEALGPFQYHNKKAKKVGEGYRNSDQSDPSIQTDFMVQSMLGTWHHESLIELAPETSIKIFLPTEKTMKPISAGIPFVSIGCYKFLRHLRKIGFKTFDPYIDESYDLEPDDDTRIGMAMSSFDKFLSEPRFLNEIQTICDHNRQTFLKIRQHTWASRIWHKLRRFITVDTLPFDVKI